MGISRHAEAQGRRIVEAVDTFRPLRLEHEQCLGIEDIKEASAPNPQCLSFNHFDIPTNAVASAT
jgi:hypothetical protein